MKALADSARCRCVARQKAARQIAQGRFPLLRSLGVKEDIFLRDNQR